MNVLKKLMMATAAVAISASAAMAERYVMITHTQGTDPFWPVVEKGGRDAAAAVGATLEYNFDVSGDMAAMAKLIEAAAASQTASSCHCQTPRRLDQRSRLLLLTVFLSSP